MGVSRGDPGRAAPRDTSSNIRVVPLFSASLSSVSSPGVSHVAPRNDLAGLISQSLVVRQRKSRQGGVFSTTSSAVVSGNGCDSAVLYSIGELWKIVVLFPCLDAEVCRRIRDSLHTYASELFGYTDGF